MRYLSGFVVSVLVLVVAIVFPVSVPAVALQTSAQEKAANLRAQLSEVETKQAELQTRRQELDEQLKPENIEKALAGFGSTRPEDLREQRRRQLEIERNGVQRQLDLLATSHSRLEAAVAQADADAYRQSAAPAGGPSINATSTRDSPGAVASPATTPTRPRRAKKKRVRRSKRQHQKQTTQYREIPNRVLSTSAAT